MKKRFLSILLTIATCTSFAQEYLALPIKNNEIGAELGGVGLFYSVYYARTFIRSGSLSLSLRAGGGPFYITTKRSAADGERMTAYGFHLIPTMLFTRKNHAWETGLGPTYFNFSRGPQFRSTYPGTYYQDDGIRSYLYLAPQTAYRLYSASHRFYFRASVLLGIRIAKWGRYNHTQQPALLPWLGFGIGYTL